MLKDLFKQIKNRILAKEDKTNQDSSTYIPIKQNGKTYNLYDLPDGFVIKGDVDLSEKGLTELPNLSKVTVRGGFSCFNNQLTSLTGAPQEVGGYFGCGGNKLTTLQGAPQKVGGDFYCSDNELTSLTGAPQEVGGDFYCNENQLTSLIGAPQKVGGDFLCYENQLTTLIGAPQKVGGDFSCSINNDLLSLFGLPQMSKNKSIHCDDELLKRYGHTKLKEGRIKYKDLIESAKYQSELSVYKIRQKKHEEKKEAQAQLKAGFEAFMKMQTEERE